MKKEEKEKVKKCFSCKKEKPISQMEQIGVWVCLDCLKKKK